MFTRQILAIVSLTAACGWSYSAGDRRQLRDSSSRQHGRANDLAIGAQPAVVVLLCGDGHTRFGNGRVCNLPPCSQAWEGKARAQVAGHNTAKNLQNLRAVGFWGDRHRCTTPVTAPVAVVVFAAGAMQYPLKKFLLSLALLFLKVNDHGAAIALVFFGFYALLKSYLIVRSTFLPRILGVLGIFGGLGWLSFLYLLLGYRLFPLHCRPRPPRRSIINPVASCVRRERTTMEGAGQRHAVINAVTREVKTCDDSSLT